MTAKKRKNKKTWLILIIILAILIAGALLAIRLTGFGQIDNLQNVKTATADIGTIVKTVTGTGNLAADETHEDITVPEGLLIDQVLVEAGDEIQTGDELATFDAIAMQTAIRQTQAELDSLDKRLYLARDDQEPTYIRSAVAGRIKQVFAQEGTAVTDTMNEYGALMMLSLDGKLKVSFRPANVPDLAEGDDVDVILADGTVLSGKIVTLLAAECVVTVSDRTAEVGETVEVKTGTDAVLGQGKLEISRPLSVTGTAGTVDTILLELNDFVSQDTRLLKLDQADHSRAYEEIYAERTDKAERLALLLDYAASNTLTATCSGLIQAVGITEGQETGPAAANPAASAAGATADGTIAAFTVRTASKILFAVDIDELDIAVMKVGQPASVTLDALTGKILTGKISEISDTGTINQGGTTFEVTVDLPADPLLRTGMTATAVITVDKREGVVRIPLEALQETDGEQYVYTGTAVSATELGDKKTVTTGISDGEYVEILSGLKSGDKLNFYYSTGNDNMFMFGNRPAATHPQELVPLETTD